MNRRQLFRTLIYAPLIAPLAWMMPEPVEEVELCFVINADTEMGELAVKRMAQAIKRGEKNGGLWLAPHEGGFVHVRLEPKA